MNTLDTMKQALEALALAKTSNPLEWANAPIDKCVTNLRAAIEQIEKREPVEKMYQVIGMNVLKNQRFQDGYFIADGDEDRICEMFYKQLRYHFPPDAAAEIERLRQRELNAKCMHCGGVIFAVEDDWNKAKAEIERLTKERDEWKSEALEKCQKKLEGVK